MARRSIKPELLEAGMEYIHAHGYNAAGVSALAEAAGAPKGSFYNHFASKEAFALEIIRVYSDSQGRQLLDDKTAPASDRLRSYFEGLRDAHIEAQFMKGCLLGNFAAEAGPEHDYIRLAVSDSFDVLEAALTTCLVELGYPADEAGATDTAKFIVDGWQGAVLRSKVVRKIDPIDRFFKFILEPILAEAPLHTAATGDGVSFITRAS